MLNAIQRPSEDFAKCIGCTGLFEVLDENQRCEVCAAFLALADALDDIKVRAHNVSEAAQRIVDDLRSVEAPAAPLSRGRGEGKGR